MSSKPVLSLMSLLVPALLGFGVSALESGPLMLQLPSAGRPIVVSQSVQAKEYLAFETKLSRTISNGKKLFAIIEDFDYEVAGHLAHAVGSQMFSLLNTDPLPEWAKPIYDYAEGIPEGRLIGNVGQVIQPYERVNSELRDSKPVSPETAEWVGRMRLALAHVPPFEGISFRGARLTKVKADRLFRTGKIALDPAFISTSIVPKVALRFALPMDNLVPSEYGKLNLLFVIKGRTGRPISGFAKNHDDEEEILFANGTSFRVVKKSPLFKLPDIRGWNQIIILTEE